MRVILAILAVLVMAGCSDNVVAQPPASRPTDNFVEPTGLLADKTWISPGVVEIGNFYPGAEADWLVRIHNGGDSPSTFKVTYRLPDNNREGFTNAPALARTWVTIENETPLIQAGETKEILINLKMPEGIKNYPPKWEFWISVVEQTGGMIQTEMCSRWLVQMKK